MLQAIENEEARTLVSGLGNTAPHTLKVTFYPDTNEMAYVADKINKQYKLPMFANYALMGLWGFNLIAFPTTLFIFEQGLLGLAIFAFNLLASIFIIPSVLKTDLRRYFRIMYGDIDDQAAELELSDEGLWCRHKGDLSFTRWEHVTEVEETSSAVHIFTKLIGISIPRTSFPYEEDAKEFVKFARAQHRNSPAAKELPGDR